jgi:hypothetical protein
MNIGFYSLNYLRDNKDYLDEFQDYSLRNKNEIQKIKIKAIEEEDFLFTNAKSTSYINKLFMVWNHWGMESYFGKMRKKEVYNNLGIIKYKANYAVKNDFEISI